MEFQKIGHPFFRPPNSSPERILAISFSTTPVKENAPWAVQRRPEGLPRFATTSKFDVQERLQDRNYRALISRRTNMKNAKNDDPCRRSATSLISGDARTSLLSGKKWKFCMGGVIKTENHRLRVVTHGAWCFSMILEVAA